MKLALLDTSAYIENGKYETVDLHGGAMVVSLLPLSYVLCLKNMNPISLEGIDHG